MTKFRVGDVVFVLGRVEHITRDGWHRVEIHSKDILARGYTADELTLVKQYVMPEPATPLAIATDKHGFAWQLDHEGHWKSNTGTEHTWDYLCEHVGPLTVRWEPEA